MNIGLVRILKRCKCDSKYFSVSRSYTESWLQSFACGHDGMPAANPVSPRLRRSCTMSVISSAKTPGVWIHAILGRLLEGWGLLAEGGLVKLHLEGDIRVLRGRIHMI